MQLTTGLGTSSFVNFLYNRRISYTKMIWEFMEVKFAMPWGILTASHYWAAYFKLGETTTILNGENRKKFLTIAIYDIA